MPLLDHLAVSPSGFVFDPTTGSTFSANPTALELIEGVRAGDGLDALVARLDAAFSARPSADLHRDVLEFVRTLRDEGLVPRTFELGA